ncbi:hypothetical protein FAI41_03360 [Acetobacteraceae bacterium]|nr:hypothetical protein FAI41_03360 [Acetobacteraceae bacterium]
MFFSRAKYFRFALFAMLSLSLFSFCFTVPDVNAALQIGSRLLYERQNNGEVPIPPSERNLLTAVVADYYRVTKENHLLAESVFDDKGNLFFFVIGRQRKFWFQATKTKQKSEGASH